MSAVETFQVAVEAFNRGDMKTFEMQLHPDMVFVPDPSWPEAGPFHGRDAYMAFVGEFVSSFARVALEVDDVREVEGWAVARSRWVTEGAASGIATDVAFTFLARERDGQIAQLTAHFDHDEAMTTLA